MGEPCGGVSAWCERKGCRGPFWSGVYAGLTARSRSAGWRILVVAAVAAVCANGQTLLRAPDSQQVVTILPSDLAVLEAAADQRKDLPCTVTMMKPQLGFDLRFHAGYEVTTPLKELAGEGNLLTIVFRVYPEEDKKHPAFFVQHITVPSINDDARGDALLEGVIDLGEGAYHVDWLMRDRAERFCSDAWDMEAALNGKDRPISLFIKTSQIEQTLKEPFVNSAVPRLGPPSDDQLNLKILLNFAPQKEESAALQRSDVDAFVTILKSIERDPRVARVSLIAFNLNETRIVYRQNDASSIDFPALGRALQTMRLGTVAVQNLQKTSETDFLEKLIQSEMGSTDHPDAVIFAGPKAMLNADVPQQDLRRIGDTECPVFYLNYNVDPRAVPWKDSISRAIRVFRGVEYTISQPRDVWFSTKDALARIVRQKHERASTGMVLKPVSTLAK